MIENILSLLSVDDWYGVSETIDIAKGKFAIPKTLKQGIKQIKRKREWKKRR